jgi:Transposase, Mutator family
MLKIRERGTVQRRACHLAIGVTVEGERDVLGMWFQEAEGAKFWMQVLSELKQRGLNDILICCVDGLKGFPEAIEAIYPATVVQTCLVHLIRHSLKYVPAPGAGAGRSRPEADLHRRRRRRLWVPRTPFGLSPEARSRSARIPHARRESVLSAHTVLLRLLRARADSRLPRTWQGGCARREACERRTRGAAGYAAILYSCSKPPSRSRRRRRSSCGNSAGGGCSSIGGLASGVRCALSESPADPLERNQSWPIPPGSSRDPAVRRQLADPP